jgi:hypothetical protein
MYITFSGSGDFCTIATWENKKTTLRQIIGKYLLGREVDGTS